MTINECWSWTAYQRGGHRKICRERLTAGEIEEPGYSKSLQLYSGSRLTPEINIVTTGEAGIKLIPADPRLSVVTVEKMPTTNNISENTRSLWRHLSLLDNVLQPIQDDFDYILIDSHPDVNDLLRTIIYSCDFEAHL